MAEDSPVRFWRAAALIGVANLLLSLLLLSGPAEAQRLEGSLTTAPATFDSTASNPWALAGFDNSPATFNQNSRVFSIAQIGNRIYVGGKFLQVTDGNVTRDQPYLAAFSATTGVHLDNFDPVLDGPVYELEASADGTRLFVGGEFSSVDGVASTAGFVALTPGTGAVVNNMRVTVSRTNGAPVVKAIDVAGNYLYLGGAFTSLSADGQVATSNNLARVSATTATPDPSWLPQANGGTVWDVETSPDGTRVYVGGEFRTIRGASSWGFATVNAVNGALVPGLPTTLGFDYFPIITEYLFVADIEVQGDRVWIGGQDHALILAQASDLQVLRHYKTNSYNAPFGTRGGDIQDIELAGEVLIAVCHCWGQIHEVGTSYFDNIRSIALFDTQSGDHLNWFHPELTGSAGSWAVHVTGDGCIWSGGDYTVAGGQAAANLVRLCPGSGQPLGLHTDSKTSSSIRLRWTPGVAVRIYRDGAQIATSSSGTYNDTGRAANTEYRYEVRSGTGAAEVSDIVDGSTFARPPVFSASATNISANQLTIRWTPTSAPVQIWRNGTQIGTNVTGGSFIDTGLTADTTYRYLVQRTEREEGWTHYGAVYGTTTGGTSSDAVAVVSCWGTRQGSNINVTWTAAANDNALRYVIERQRNDGQFWWTGAVNTGNGRAFLNTNLNPGTYQYRVRTVAANGTTALHNCGPTAGNTIT